MRRLVVTCSLLSWLACDADVPEPAPAPARPERPQAGEPGPKALDGTLRVVLLGTGTPIPDPQRAGPCTAVVVGGQPYLVDAGPGVVRQAEAARRKGIAALDPLRLDRLFLTHLHSDHTVGLPDVLRTPAVIGRSRPLQVFGPSGTVAMVEHVQAAYRVDENIRRDVEGTRAGYEVTAHDVTTGVVYRDSQVTVTAFAVEHGSFTQALGYRFEGAGRRVVVSGDTTATDAVVEACDGCDVLVHEVYCAAGLTKLEASVQQYHQRFHTSSVELAALARRARPGLLVLTHLLTFGCTPMQLLAEVRAGYEGEVVLGEDLEEY